MGIADRVFDDLMAAGLDLDQYHFITAIDMARRMEAHPHKPLTAKQYFKMRRTASKVQGEAFKEVYKHFKALRDGERKYRFKEREDE